MNHYLPRAESEFVKASGGTEFLKGLVRKAMEGNEPQVDVRAVAPRPCRRAFGSATAEEAGQVPGLREMVVKGQVVSMGFWTWFFLVIFILGGIYSVLHGGIFPPYPTGSPLP
jgi:hypothetical protein